MPAVSRQNDEIQNVAARMQVWQDCYNGFVRNLNAASPLGKRIPADIADLLTKDEADRAHARLGEVYERVAQDAKVTAKLVLADYAAWRDATDAYVAEHNRIVKNAPALEALQEYETRRDTSPGR